MQQVASFSRESIEQQGESLETLTASSLQLGVVENSLNIVSVKMLLANLFALMLLCICLIILSVLLVYIVWKSTAESLLGVLVGLGADFEGHSFLCLQAISACAYVKCPQEVVAVGSAVARGAAGGAVRDREQSLYLSWEVEDKKE